MNVIKFLELSDKYNDCPNCGSDKIGNGEGTLKVLNETYIRTCKCGWNIEVKTED